jgi:hypothetical protein
MRTTGTFAKSVATKIVVFYFLKTIPLEQEIIPFILYINNRIQSLSIGLSLMLPTLHVLFSSHFSVRWGR